MMNNFTFESQGSNTYLVYAVAPEETLDTMNLGMLTHNKIPGIATTVFSQMDKERFIRYNVSAKITVRQFFNGPVNKKRLLGVLSGVVDAMLSAEDYMLEPGSLLLDQDYIFADVSTCEAVMICLPIEGMEQNHTDIAAFFKSILFNTQFDQSENCDHVARLINYLNSSPAFSLVDFKRTLESIKKAGQQVSSTQTNNRAAEKPLTRQPQPQVLNPQKKQEIFKPHVDNRPVKEIQPQPSIPPVSATNQENTKSTAQTSIQKDEKKMSFMYLMQHYNKENAALYKAQKDAEKTQGKHEAGKKDKKPSKADKNTAQRQKFEVPGAAPATGFAVPGQTPTAASFAVPGQAAVQPASQETLPPKTGKPEPVKQPSVQPTHVNLPNMPTTSVPSTGGRASFGETTVLNMGSSTKGETVVLNATNTVAQVRPYLIRKKNNEKILIDKPVYRIGKERSYVDYFIGDNAAISRSHANIVTRDGEYFVVDTNSKNHTYVEGEMIQSNMEMPIHNGSQIRMANEDFEFKLG